MAVLVDRAARWRPAARRRPPSPGRRAGGVPSPLSTTSGASSIRSKVVKRWPQPRHSRRRRMAAPSSVARESTTLSSSTPQPGHRTARHATPDRRRARAKRAGAQPPAERRYRGVRRYRQQQAVVLEEAGQAQGARPPATAGPTAARADEPAARSGGEGEAPLVDEVGGEELAVEGGPALAQHHAGRGRRGRRGPPEVDLVVAGHHDLGHRLERGAPVGGAGGAGEHDRRRRRRTAGRRVEVAGAGHHRDAGPGRAVGAGPAPARSPRPGRCRRRRARRRPPPGGRRTPPCRPDRPAGPTRPPRRWPRRRWRPCSRAATVGRRWGTGRRRHERRPTIDVVDRFGQQLAHRGSIAPHADGGHGRRTAFRTCPLCEAGCGLEITLKPRADGAGEEVARIRGDLDDVFSHGFICPKGSTLWRPARRPRPGAAAPRQARRRVRRGRLGRGVGRGRPAASRRSSAAHGRNGGGGVPGQPQRPQHRRPACTAGASSSPSARPTSSRRAPSTSGRRRSRRA